MVFHDRRLQYMEHQQLEGWKWNRPGDRLLDIGEVMLCDHMGTKFRFTHAHSKKTVLGLTVRHVFVTDIPMSVGITESHTHTSQLNAAEFLWDVSKRTSVFVQVRAHVFPQRSVTNISKYIVDHLPVLIAVGEVDQH